MSIMMKVFIYLTIVALLMAVLSFRRTVQPPITQEEIDANVDAIRSNINVWADFTRNEIVSILGWLSLLALTSWSVYWAFENRELIQVFINRLFSIPT